MTTRRRPAFALALAGLALLGPAAGAGCSSLSPRNFRALNAPAPIVRARAVGLGQGQPDAAVVPALIGRLDDADPVVRLSAHEELKRRSGQDFGYLPWSDRAERAPAIAGWKQWWDSAGPARARQQAAHDGGKAPRRRRR